jgi:hypothetical protein
MARWRASSLFGMTPGQAASGWLGAMAKTKSLRVHNGRVAMPLRAGMSPGAPMTRSARPVAKASQVPPRDFVKKANLGAVSGAVKALKQRIEAFDWNDGVDCNAQFGLPAIGDALYTAFQFVGGAQQMASLVEQGAAGFIECRAAAFTNEKLNIQFALQFGDGMRQR